MKKGDYIETPRFCKVKIEEVFDSEKLAREEGYVEPTHYTAPDYYIRGKHIGTNRMVFAAARK